MHVWVEILQMLLEIGYKLLRKYSEASAADFRKRVSADGAGMLMTSSTPVPQLPVLKACNVRISTGRPEYG